MNVASLPQIEMMRAIDAIGALVSPAVHRMDSQTARSSAS